MTQSQQYQQQAPANPWEQAAAQYGGQPAQQFQQGQAAYAAAPPQQYQAPAMGGALADSMDEDESGSLLFGGGQSALSMFNRTHLLGTKRKGRILGVRDVHAVDLETRALKYWRTTKVEGLKSWTFDPMDAPTGKRNDPIKEVWVSTQTDYRVTRQEWAAVRPNRVDEFRDGEDDGLRNFIASGQGVAALKKAIREANAKGGGITSYKSLQGWDIEVERAGQKPNGQFQPSWILEITLTRP